ncbi:hypothetical protein E3C22_19040 [Jiella endophytica]|uniref:Uncharacterized protein n=1 Tax=Jiella endophytica TaxID=2558362 RepID=A0A4Y8RDV6_9HYPH|nr:hypothetical protein [Jiella endophytica]TFF19781.1 hypothetical protein E3C22_19040 [Jiella endophytica]
MGEIGRITKTVSVDELPEDMRERFVPGTPVSVTFEGEMYPSAAAHDAKETPNLSVEEIERRKASLHRFWGVGADLGTTTEEAVARIRALRDEWD